MSSLGLVIRHELPHDRDDVHALHRTAFAQDDEARLVDALRKEGYARVSLVAECQGNVVGHLMLSQLTLADDSKSTLSLAPVAVLPSWQQQGIGSELIRRSLSDAADLGYHGVFVLGDPAYYRRFGFTPDLAGRFACEYAGDAWMAIELVTGSLAATTGRVDYPPPFQSL